MVVSFIMTTAVFKIMFGEEKKTKAPEKDLFHLCDSIIGNNAHTNIYKETAKWSQ